MLKLGSAPSKDFKPGGSSTRNWYLDRYQKVLVQRNILALITLFALLAVLLSTVSIAQLSPLKTVQPFLITVDEKSGITQVVDPMDDTDISSNQALIQYFVVKYIMARESYDVNVYQKNFEVVRLMSKPDVFVQYRKFYDPNNAESPLVKIGSDLNRSVELLSLSFLDEKLVQVRLKITNQGTGGRYYEEKNYIALVNFTFAKLDLPLKDRYINPLGFQVTSYRLDEDFVNR